MAKRSLIVFALTLVLVTSAVPIGRVHGVLMTPDEVAMLDAASRDADDQSKGDNTFVRVLKAPIKAIGRLFGVGKKDDDKPQRLSRKDVKKFESVGATKVVDARTPASETPATPITAADAAQAPARENLERGRALLNSGNAADAITVLSAAIAAEPKLHEAYSLMGVAYEMKGLRDRAFESLQKAVKADDDNGEYLNNLGFLYFKNGDHDKAAKYLKRAVKAAPQVQRYWNNLGLVQAQRANFDDAYDCFVRAVGEYEGHINVANRSQAMGYDKTAIKHLEQARVLRMVPGMENAEFLQFGQIHRNTYICSPRVLAPTMQMREQPNVFFAGQITGVEGYVESVAMGWLAGINAARLVDSRELIAAPASSATGALARYVSGADAKNFQPVNITFALLEPLTDVQRKSVRRKRDRHALQVKLALEQWDKWLQEVTSERTALPASA